MTRQETIKYLNLDSQSPIEETDTKSVYELDQKQYAKIFTLLDRNESDWNEDSEGIDNSDDSKMISNYYSKTGTLVLDADLDEDVYTITIEDKE